MSNFTIQDVEKGDIVRLRDFTGWYELASMDVLTDSIFLKASNNFGKWVMVDEIEELARRVEL